MAWWLGGLVAGWLRKAENKGKAQHSWGLNFAELGNIGNVTDVYSAGVWVVPQEIKGAMC